MKLPGNPDACKLRFDGFVGTASCGASGRRHAAKLRGHRRACCILERQLPPLPTPRRRTLPALPAQTAACKSGRAVCRCFKMQIGTLYEQAVGLSPRAARIAAGLLVDDPLLPMALRRALRMALWADDGRPCFAGDGGDEAFEEAAAAARFVAACRDVYRSQPGR